MVHGTLLEKIQPDSTLTEKNIYFCFWLLYYYGAWNLEKNPSEFDPPQKKKIIILGYNTIMVLGVYKCFNWYLILTE